MNISEFIVPLGILTYSMVLVTALSGIFHMKLKNHRFLAIIAVALATLHGGLVIYLKYL
jgi:hypothetical protein